MVHTIRIIHVIFLCLEVYILKIELNERKICAASFSALKGGKEAITPLVCTKKSSFLFTITGTGLNKNGRQHSNLFHALGLWGVVVIHDFFIVIIGLFLDQENINKLLLNITWYLSFDCQLMWGPVHKHNRMQTYESKKAKVCFMQ